MASNNKTIKVEQVGSPLRKMMPFLDPVGVPQPQSV